MTVAVTVAAIARRDHLRLRWLLNALSEQSGVVSFDVVVAHDGRLEAMSRLLASHPLREQGRLRAVVVLPGQTVAAARNAAWRAGAGELVLFTEEDCLPAADWIEQAVSGARARPGAVLEGTTFPDPYQSAILHGASWPAAKRSHPPTGWGRASNIGYPRRLLERLGGFDERLQSHEDTDLLLRAQAAGAAVAPAMAMVVHHAVHPDSLLRALWRRLPCRHLPLLVRRHPSLRRQLWGGMWLCPEHPAVLLMLAGVLACRHRGPAPALLALPWLVLNARPRTRSRRGAVRHVAELPGRALIDAAEVVLLAGGSVRHRTLVI